jgi:hypothetical protein
VALAVVEPLDADAAGVEMMELVSDGGFAAKHLACDDRNVVGAATQLYSLTSADATSALGMAEPFPLLPLRSLRV